MNKGPPVLPVTTKDNDPLHLSDMHAGSEAYHIDIDASYRSSPMKIIWSLSSLIFKLEITCSKCCHNKIIYLQYNYN